MDRNKDRPPPPAMYMHIHVDTTIKILPPLLLTNWPGAISNGRQRAAECTLLPAHSTCRAWGCVVRTCGAWTNACALRWPSICTHELCLGLCGWDRPSECGQSPSAPATCPGHCASVPLLTHPFSCSMIKHHLAGICTTPLIIYP